MKRIDQLRAVTDRKNLAHLLGFKPKALAYIVYKKPAGLKYFPFQVQKRSGGVRTIHAPAADLKVLQSRLSELLQDCITDINEEKNVSSSISHGFRRKRSIVTNARCHRHKRWVFNIDLEDFFGSINFGRVRGFFLQNNNFKLHPEVATTIAQIACHDNALPQGSPCSPVISNLIAHVMDIRLAKLASQHGCSYSRYADDLTFSTNKADFPEAIAHPSLGAPHIWEPGDTLTKVIQRSGFSINPSKTRMQYSASRQDVTGLVVNSKVNVRREYEKTVRAMVHHVCTTGGFYRKEYLPDLLGDMIEVQSPGTLNQLQGRLSFVHDVKRSNWSKTNPQPKNRVGYEKTYRSFLFYRYFYANGSPLILCEGKTDNIYLKCAIRSLAAKVPGLAEKKGKKVVSKVQFMSYTGTTERILDLSGGIGPLANLVGVYSGIWKSYAAGHLKQPVIVVVDNDKAAKRLFGSLSKMIGKTVDGSEKFIHACHNLYVIPIPRNGSQEAVIESLFHSSVRNQKVGGKVFNPAKTYASESEYGKYVFAEAIVRPQQDKIDFSKFEPLLNNIEEAITDYAAKP